MLFGSCETGPTRGPFRSFLHLSTGTPESWLPRFRGSESHGDSSIHHSWLQDFFVFCFKNLDDHYHADSFGAKEEVGPKMWRTFETGSCLLHASAENKPEMGQATDR